MNWIGKAVGGVLGFALGGGLLGGLLGLFIGHQVDRGLDQGAQGAFSKRRSFDPAPTREAFFKATFSVMGHLAKADGRVSEEEIRAARSVMHQMNLSPEQVQAAIRLFTQGKDAGFPLEHTLAALRQACHGRRDLLRAFVEIQMQAVLTSGQISRRDRELLWRVSHELGVSRVELAQIEALLRARSWAGGQRGSPAGVPVGDSYKVLGVGTDATDAEVKKAYRRLMNQHHPDKLVARGLPESMMQVSKEKTREIRAAYDTIKKARGMR